MAEVKIDKQQGTQSGSQSTGMQTGGQTQGLASRGSWPSFFALSPHHLFNTSPFELMRRFSEEMDRAFGEFGLSREWGLSEREAGAWSPPVEVFEHDNNLVVRAELPGLSKED